MSLRRREAPPLRHGRRSPRPSHHTPRTHHTSERWSSFSFLAFNLVDGFDLMALVFFCRMQRFGLLWIVVLLVFILLLLVILLLLLQLHNVSLLLVLVMG